MRNLYTYSLLLLCFLFGSCEEFLEENPTTQFNKGQIYSSVDGAQAALNACYAYISNSSLYGLRLQVVLTCGAGTMTAGTTSSAYVELAKLDIQTNNTAVAEVYEGLYITINAINDVLLNLKDSPIDQVERDRIIGEAYFLRALCYFNLVRLFGPVPLVIEPASSIESAHKPRTSIGEVYTTIIEDLENAWELLPVAGKQPKGRPYNYAAKFLLSKVYIAMACIKENPGEPFDASWLEESTQSYWQKAYDYASDVYTNGGYSLVDQFNELWDCYNPYTAESIFELEENVMTGSTTFMYHYLPGYWEELPLTASSNNYGRLRAMRESYDLHFNRYEGDFRLDETFIQYSYKRNMTTTSNPGRVYYTYPYTRDNLPPTGEMSSSEELPYLRKYKDPRFTAFDANVNVIVFRYADLILMMAESANELGKTSEAIGLVNQLLDRARNTPTGCRTAPADWNVSMSKEETRQYIMEERLIELKGELHEWFDNRRRGIAYFKNILQKHNDRLNELSSTMTYDYYFGIASGSGGNKVYSLTQDYVKKNMLCPFPMVEITSNNNISEKDQNFGY